MKEDSRLALHSALPVPSPLPEMTVLFLKQQQQQNLHLCQSPHTQIPLLNKSQGSSSFPSILTLLSKMYKTGEVELLHFLFAHSLMSSSALLPVAPEAAMISLRLWL